MGKGRVLLLLLIALCVIHQTCSNPVPAKGKRPQSVAVKTSGDPSESVPELKSPPRAQRPAGKKPRPSKDAAKRKPSADPADNLQSVTVFKKDQARPNSTKGKNRPKGPSKNPVRAGSKIPIKGLVVANNNKKADAPIQFKTTLKCD